MKNLIDIFSTVAMAVSLAFFFIDMPIDAIYVLLDAVWIKMG